MRWKSCLVLLVLLAAVIGEATAQTRIVSGRVTDAATNQPIASAQISIRGSSVSAFSDANGNFTIGVPEGNQRLLVRLIGFKRADVLIGANQSTADVQLERDVLNLEEIVVTGQATGVERRNLANAVATVNAEDLARAPSASFEQALQGKVAGANIQANNGAPGGGIQIQLRGTSSIIGEHRPLYVVDGVIVSNDEIASNVHVVTVSSSNPVSGGNQDNAPNRIADLNPNDIESIEI